LGGQLLSRSCGISHFFTATVKRLQKERASARID
jgi:hypothetical protein